MPKLATLLRKLATLTCCALTSLAAPIALHMVHSGMGHGDIVHMAPTVFIIYLNMYFDSLVSLSVPLFFVLFAMRSIFHFADATTTIATKATNYGNKFQCMRLFHFNINSDLVPGGTT